MEHKEFLNWIADRFVNVYGESGNVDFVIALRRRADEIESLRAENAKLKEDLANRTRQLSEVVLKLRQYEAVTRSREDE